MTHSHLRRIAPAPMTDTAREAEIARLRRPADDLELLCRVCNAAHYLELKFGTLPFRIVWEGGNAV